MAIAALPTATTARPSVVAPDGYSLSTPALYSKPAANLLARSLSRTIQNRSLPNMMSLAVNDECNARCEHCSFFQGQGPRPRHRTPRRRSTRRG